MEKVSIKRIKKAMFDEMSKEVGTSDLYWIECLFDYGLGDNLGIKDGILELENDKTRPVEDKIHKRGFYNYGFPEPKAQLFSPNVPEDYLIFVLGPQHYKKSSLEILCVAPLLNGRDQEELSVLSELDEKVRERMKGKHVSVKGKLIVPEKDWERYARVMEKSFGPIVQPSANFRNDIQDLVICARIYQGFERYQEQRDDTAIARAAKIITAVSKI